MSGADSRAEAAAALADLLTVPDRLASLERALEPLCARVESMDSRLPPALLTVEQAAKVLGCSVATVRRRITAGELPTTRSGRLLRVDVSHLRGAGGAP